MIRETGSVANLLGCDEKLSTAWRISNLGRILENPNLKFLTGTGMRLQTFASVKCVHGFTDGIPHHVVFGGISDEL